jgi:hypothetical protein
MPSRVYGNCLGLRGDSILCDSASWRQCALEALGNRRRTRAGRVPTPPSTFEITATTDGSKKSQTASVTLRLADSRDMFVPAIDSCARRRNIYEPIRLRSAPKSLSPHSGRTKKYLAAKLTSASPVVSPSFSRLRRRCVCTVVNPISSSLEMSRVDNPRARQRRHAVSRSVSSASSLGIRSASTASAISGSLRGHIHTRKCSCHKFSISSVQFSLSVTTLATAVLKDSRDRLAAFFQSSSPTCSRVPVADFQTTRPCQSQSPTYVSANVISDVTLSGADG